jgi:hypothetical protein
MHSLLLGNGINRVAMQRGWNEILQELARTFDGQDLIAGIEAKPLSMFIEELCARSSLSFQKAERCRPIQAKFNVTNRPKALKISAKNRVREFTLSRLPR